MRTLKSLMSAFLIVLLAMATAGPLAARQAEPPSPDEVAASLDGLQTMYGRMVTYDFSAPAPDDQEASWLVIGTYVLAFDSEENAVAAMAPLSEQGPITAFAMQMDGAPVEEVELDIEAEHTALQVQSEDGDDIGTLLQVVVQDGEHLYLAFGMNLDSDPAPKITALLTTMLEGEAGDEPEQHNADGTSTGGLWDLLPTVDDLQADATELTAVEDTVVFPDAASTPAS